MARTWDWGSIEHCALVQALAHDGNACSQLSEAVASGDWAAEQALTVAEQASRGERRRRVRNLRHYLRTNWDGVRGSEGAERLGVIEGQVFHHIARRMKQHGTRWSEAGADHLARLLAALANGELVDVTQRAWRMQPAFLLAKRLGRRSSAEVHLRREYGFNRLYTVQFAMRLWNCNLKPTCRLARWAFIPSWVKNRQLAGMAALAALAPLALRRHLSVVLPLSIPGILL